MPLTQWAKTKNPAIRATAKKAKTTSVRRRIACAIRTATGPCFSLPAVIACDDNANRVPMHVIFYSSAPESPRAGVMHFAD